MILCAIDLSSLPFFLPFIHILAEGTILLTASDATIIIIIIICHLKTAKMWRKHPCVILFSSFAFFPGLNWTEITISKSFYLWYRRMITWYHILMMMRMALWMMMTWMRALSTEWHVSWVNWRTSMVTSSVPASLSSWLPKYVHLIILSRLKTVVETIPNRKLVYCDISLSRVLMEEMLIISSLSQKVLWGCYLCTLCYFFNWERLSLRFENWNLGHRRHKGTKSTWLRCPAILLWLKLSHCGILTVAQQIILTYKGTATDQWWGLHEMA